MNSTARHRLAAAVLTAGLALPLAGCSYDGVTSIPLPFREGADEDALSVTVNLDDASGLTPNSEVKVDDVTVGTVRSIDLKAWKPVAVIQLNKDVDLPANALPRVGQKSLLGAKYLELSSPARADRARLSNGAVLQAAKAGNYPQTEQVLASLSLVLNGGGLQQVQTIAAELNEVLGGREPEIRQFIQRFNVFIGSLDRQRHDILDAVARLDALSATLRRNGVLARAIENLPTAFGTLEEHRAQLTRALTALAALGDTAKTVVKESGADLSANLRNLRPALAKLAVAGHNIAPALTVAGTLPFPANTSFPKMFQGDYGNLFITLDTSPELLAENLLRGFQPSAGSESSSLMQAPPLGEGDGEPPISLPELPGLDNTLGGVNETLDGLLSGSDSSSSSSGADSGLSGLLPGLLGANRTGGAP